MSKLTCVHLTDRGVLRIAGDDARVFLQGLISNDVQDLDQDRAIWAAFLTPQGRYLHDFFISAHDGELLLDCEADRLEDLKRRLSIYRLRSRVTLTDARPEYAVWALTGDGAADALDLPSGKRGVARPLTGGRVFTDPRLADIGARALLPAESGAQALGDLGFVSGERSDYDRLRIALGLPDGSRDSIVEKSLLLECGFEELHGIDWNKGCYLGQELTARTRYRGLVKRRLLPVATEGSLPSPGTPITLAGKEVGEVRSGLEGMALAILRLEALDASERGGELRAGEARLHPRRPSWAIFAREEQS